jgi:hypothetical protein
MNIKSPLTFNPEHTSKNKSDIDKRCLSYRESRSMPLIHSGLIP